MKMILLILIYSIYFSVFAQEEKCGMNLIIVVDDEICIGSIGNIQIIEGGRRLQVDYIPGNLSINSSDLRKLNMSEAELVLYIEFYQNIGKKQVLYNYELPFYVDWLDQEYIILRIYNLDKRKYRKIYKPLDQTKNYTFEIDYSGGSMKRVQK